MCGEVLPRSAVPRRFLSPVSARTGLSFRKEKRMIVDSEDITGEALFHAQREAEGFIRRTWATIDPREKAPWEKMAEILRRDLEG